MILVSDVQLGNIAKISLRLAQLGKAPIRRFENFEAAVSSQVKRD